MAGHPYTDEDDRIILECVQKYQGAPPWVSEAAERTGRNPRAVGNRYRYYLAHGRKGAQVPPVRPVDPVVAEQARLERVRSLRAEVEAMRAVAGEKSLRKMIADLFAAAAKRVDPPPRYRPPAAGKANVVTESALLHLTDWHYGEVVKPERVRGFNGYDQETATLRARSVVKNARGILARLRTGGYRFPDLVVAANGDFVTGSIHDLEKHANGKSIVESVVECAYLLAECVRDLAADFEHVTVFGTVGNHGRLPDARRMEQKSPLRNWDALVYLFAQCALRDVKNVELVIPDSYAVGYVVSGQRVVQTHGHQVKAWAGIPWYGIERKVSRITNLEARRGTPPDVVLFGHFHTSAAVVNGAEALVNGSLIGGTEYSVDELGKADKPAQWLYGVHREHGFTHRWPVYPTAGMPTLAPEVVRRIG